MVVQLIEKYGNMENIKIFHFWDEVKIRIAIIKLYTLQILKTIQKNLVI